jgi:hypothetical protein
MGIVKILLVWTGMTTAFRRSSSFMPIWDQVELRFHRPGRAALNEIAETVITVRDDTHDRISLHALLHQEAVEETIGPTWIRRDKDETRAELSIALYATRCYLCVASATSGQNARRKMRDFDLLRKPPQMERSG